MTTNTDVVFNGYSFKELETQRSLAAASYTEFVSRFSVYSFFSLLFGEGEGARF